MSVAAAGAVGYLGGMGLNAWGQNQALDAMRDVWAQGTAQQAQQDAKLNQAQDEALAQINPSSFLGQGTAADLSGQLDTSARHVVAAMGARAKRRPGKAESAAVGRQRWSGSLPELLRSGQLQAILAGLRQGGQNTGETARQLGINSGVIRDDARSYAGLLPLQEQAAGMQGSWARQLGQLFQGLGMTGIMAGLSAPGAGAAQAGSPTAAATGTYYPGAEGGFFGDTSLGAYDFVGNVPAYGAV